MNSQSKTPFHSVDEEWLASYCAGGLSHAKRLLIACQAALKPALSSRLNTMDNVGGALLETAQGEAVSSDFFARVQSKLESAPEAPASAVTPATQTSDKNIRSWMPVPLADFLEHTGQTLQWKKLGFGMQRASLSDENGEELYLIKAKPGMKVPRHTHQGEEWALILQGGYHVGDNGYGLGDLHREDENCVHQPVVDDDGEACITLVAIEGSLKFSNPFMRLIKPMIGI